MPLPPAARVSLTPALAGLLVLSACVGERTEEVDLGPGPHYADSDLDTIIDVHEGPQDTDGDGRPDYLDDDSDGDGLPDSLEAGDADPLSFPLDSDGDGLSDFRDTDSDGNRVPDATEVGPDPLRPLDLDGDGLPDYVDPDNDGDGIRDLIEIGPAQVLDSDADGTPDYLDLDSDLDTIQDAEEARVDADGTPADTDGDGLPDYRDLDSDGDGYSDALEAGDKEVSTAPRDTDGDGLADAADTDADGDGLADKDEASYGTDPWVADTDGDGYTDGGELVAHSDPTLDSSTPSGLYFVVPQRSQVQEGFDFLADIGRADVVFILDSTGSMGPTLNSLANNFATVVSEVSSTIPDAAFAVATFKDYSAGGPDKPFYLHHQVSTDLASVQNSLSNLVDGGGGDSPEAAMEALYQAAVGTGYDQDCDENFDTAVDVPPFLKSIQDVFGGTATGMYDESDVSTGLIGGVGLRRYALPVFVWTTDTMFRDPDDGDPALSVCGAAAGEGAAVAALTGIGGKLISVNAGDEAPLTQAMTKLSQETWSFADVDGDGITDPLVFSSKGGPDIVQAVVRGVTALHASGEFQKVELKVEGDTWGFVRDIEPPYYSRVSPGQTLSFALTLFGAAPASEDDQVYNLRLVVVGDGATSLDSQQITVVVPGSAQ